MNIEDMRYVLKIAEKGSITKASQALFITQPSLSQRLQKIEAELNVQLFERNRFGEVSLTEAGNLYCTECANILSHYQRLTDGLQILKGRQSLTMGVPVRIGYMLVEGLLEDLTAAHPGVSLSFLDHSNYEMEEMVAKGALDFALIRLAAPNSNYTMRPISQPQPAICLRKGSPLFEKIYYHPGDSTPYIDLQLLENEPLVAPPVSKSYRTRLWIDSLLAQVPNLHGRILYTVPDIRIYDHYLKSGAASCISAVDQLPENACRLESQYALPYTLYLVQNKHTDSSIADTIYQSLLHRLSYQNIP